MKRLIIPLVALALVGGLELLALSKGIDGSCLAAAFALIGAIATGGTMKLLQHLKEVDFELKLKGKRSGH